jgi:hypothetical protein
VNPVSVTALLTAAYPFIKGMVVGLITDQVSGLIAEQVKKPIKIGKERISRALGTLSPELAGVLQNVIAQAYVMTVESIVNNYLAEQENKVLRSSQDIEDEIKLREKLRALRKKKIYEIAPSIETIDILPVEQISEDHALHETLMASVRQTLGGLPQDLESKFESSLVPTLTGNLWRQITKSLDDEEGKSTVYAFIFQALNRIEETADNAATYSRQTLEKFVELSAQMSALQESTERVTNELNEQIERAKDRYRRWVLESNETFLVPGLDVRLPIHEAWDELWTGVRTEPSSESKSLARQIRRYHEWERLADNARRRSDVYSADAALIAGKRLVIIGGPGSGKSTLSRRLTVWAAKKGALAIRVSLKRVGRLLREGTSFDKALLATALDGSDIPEDVGKAALASPDYLIADGLDESDPNRAEMANHLATWASGHPDCHVCVMTRPVGHTASLLPGFNHAELLPLNDTAIGDFTAKLIAVKENDPARRARLIADFTGLVGDYKEDRRVASIAARNPLLLSFLLALFLEGKSLKDRRAELFEQIIDLIRRSPMSDRMSTADIDVATAERVIEVAAWHLINSPNIDLKALWGEVASDLKIQSGSPPLEAKRHAEQGLKFWEEHRLIERLTLGQTEAYTFVHLSLEEYLVALYVSHMEDDELRSWLSKARREVRWRQPILLASGAGAVERIVPILLELDEPTDPTSIEAMIAASCLSEAGHVTEELAGQVIGKLRQRLTSSLPLVAIEAGEGLRQLAPLAPELVSSITADILEHEQEWTRLAAFTARLVAGGQYVTLDQIRKWLDELQLVRMLHFTGESAERRISDLPGQAYDLQEFAFVTAIGRLFEELSLEDARADALKYLKHNMPSRLLYPLEEMLSRYDSVDLIDTAFEEDSPAISFAPEPWRNSDGSSPDVILIEAIIAAARASIEGEAQTTLNPSESEFTSLSTLISAFRFLKVGFTVFHALAKRQEEAGFHEVLRAAISVLGLDPIELLSEAEVALARLKESDEISITSFIRHIPVKFDWGRAKEVELNPSKLVSAIGHPSRVVVGAAAYLLLKGVNEEDVRPLVLQALEGEGEFALEAMAGVVPRLWEPEEAARILLRRLEGKPAPGFGYIYMALGAVVTSCEESTGGEVAKAILDGLYAEEHAAALAAAEVLFALPLRNSQTLHQLLKRAFLYWTDRVEREDREAPAHVIGSGENSSRIRVVEPDPLVTLVKLLTKLDALDTEELLSLSSAIDPGISGEAIRALTASAASQPDLLKSLLTRIKEGLTPYPSSTTLNLLDTLLGLPRETLQPVENELLAIAGAEIPAIRARLISSLTSEWATPEAALKVAQEAVNDPVPRVRNSAVQTLRLLNRKG